MTRNRESKPERFIRLYRRLLDAVEGQGPFKAAYLGLRFGLWARAEGLVTVRPGKE